MFIKHNAPIKTKKNRDTCNNNHNYPKIWTVWFHQIVTGPQDAEEMAALTVVTDETVLFTQTYLFKYLELLSYLL